MAAFCVPFDKLLAVGLLFLAYKILTREMARYRELVPDYDPR